MRTILSIFNVFWTHRVPSSSKSLRNCVRARKGHWIWFIFPQIKGLGYSPAANKFAISCRVEAEAYLKHPILGPRLRDCTTLVIQIESRSIEQIFGYPDNLKFRSSMTLFAHATVDNQLFESALRKYFDGKPDPLTLERL